MSGGGARRLTRLKFDRQDDLALSELARLETGNQLFRRPLAQGVSCRTHGRQDGVDIAPDFKGVEAGDLHLLRNPEARIETRLHRGDGHLIITANDGVRRWGPTQRLERRVVAHLKTFVAAADDLEFGCIRFGEYAGCA